MANKRSLNDIFKALRDGGDDDGMGILPSKLPAEAQFRCEVAFARNRQCVKAFARCDLTYMLMRDMNTYWLKMTVYDASSVKL